MKIKNSELEHIFNTLISVDKQSTDLDFGIRFQNKNNFKNLKEAYNSMTDTFQDIFSKYGEKKTENGKMFWIFWDNKDLVDKEIKKIYAIEVEVDLNPVKILCKKDPVTNKTDTNGLVINSNQMEILKDVFEFEMES